MELIDCVNMALNKINERGNVEQKMVENMEGIEELKDCRERAIERRDIYRECSKLIKFCIEKHCK